MIKFENIGFKYNESGEEILQGINFTLESGAYHFLTGPSGSGKTSLMNLMSLGNMPTEGHMTMFGKKISTLKREDLFELRQRIGVVFQDFRLLKHLSIFDNVALPLRIMGESDENIKNYVSELLDWVGLEKHKNNLPPTLSGGQQQRVAIARAVIGRPKLLLADEPTGNLDDEIGFRLMGLFEQLNRMGTTIVIATHNANIIEQFGHPRLILGNGNLHTSQSSNAPIAQKIRNVF